MQNETREWIMIQRLALLGQNVLVLVWAVFRRLLLLCVMVVIYDDNLSPSSRGIAGTTEGWVIC